MSTINYMGIIEEYIPPGLRAYQIEEGRVDLTDYLNELQNQIAEVDSKFTRDALKNN